MDKKILIPVAFLAFILALVLANAYIESSTPVTHVNLAVSSEGSSSISQLTKEIRTYDYFEGYDNETVAWMESLGNKKVFSGNGTYVIMSSSDARKIPTVFATDVYIEEIIECDLVENRSLGNTEYPRDVLVVKNVKYLGENVIDLNGA